MPGWLIGSDIIFKCSICLFARRKQNNCDVYFFFQKSWLIYFLSFLHRSFLKRSLSDGNIPCESNSPLEVTDVGQMEEHNQSFPHNMHDGNKDLSESTPEISTCESELSYTR